MNMQKAAALALAGCCLNSGATLADNVPGVGSWVHYRFSRDPTPITVVLTRKFPVPELAIPRSYISFANEAPPSTAGPLPTVLVSHHVRLAFAEPTGDAWSVRLTDFVAAGRSTPMVAARTLRPDLYLVDLRPNASPDWKEMVRKGLKSPPAHRIEDFEGLTQFSVGAPAFIGDEDDYFVGIRCSGTPNPQYFCTYSFKVTENVVAYANFMDFRFHGGRAYANRRVRFARDVICRFLPKC